VNFSLFPLLTHFAAVFPTRLRVVSSRWWLPFLALPGVSLLTALVLDSGKGLLLPPGLVQFSWGWATILFGIVPFLGALTFAFGRFTVASFHAAPGRQRDLLRYCSLGLLVFLSYYLAVLVREPLDGYLLRWPIAAAVSFKIVELASAAATVTILGFAVTRTREKERLLWIGASVLPAVTAIAFDNYAGGLVGLWRSVTVGFLFYAVAKCTMLDIELRLRRTASWAAMGFFAVATWAVSAYVLALASGTNASDLGFLAVTGVVGVVAGILAFRPINKLVQKQFPYIRSTEEYKLRRRLEVYRAALDAGLERPSLDTLARDLGLRSAERLIIDRAATDGDGEQTAGRLAGRYVVLSRLADGVFGRVLLARDERLGDDVVLKEFRGFGGAAASQSFAHEAKALGELEHPNIVRVRDVFRAGDDLLLVTEHATGGNLDDRLRRSGPLPEDEALRITEQVLAGLAMAHKKGIVHRDMKPANILFHRGQVKLCDFGVALDPVLDGALRAAKAQPGTIGWMAPEQARGDGATPASDAYSVGAVLYRMLAGRHYVSLDGMGEQAARRAILEDGPALPLSGISPATNALMARALAKDPKDRYRNAAAMLSDVRRALRQPATATQTLQNPQPYGAGDTS
jgi:serine/threonine-protein kinase